MKTIIKNIGVINFPIKIALIILFGFIVSQCKKEPQDWARTANDMVITEYVYSLPEQFSEFGGILKYTGVENLLRVRGPFTLMLPTDEAMKTFYAKNGKLSYEDFDVDFLTDLAYNHIMQGSITAGVIGSGSLSYQNGLNDNVASDLRGIDIVLNKQAKIIKRDIKVSNGYVHHIDCVMDIVTQSVYDVLGNDGGYTIFQKGLETAGLSDTLKKITIPYGNTTPRVFYTLLAVPDTLYQREGINNIDDLIAKYDTDGDHKSDSNGFFQYMENHCLSGSHYFTEFNKENVFYLITQNNYVTVVDQDLIFKINKVNDSTYSEFYFDQSNIPAKNGCIHTVNTQLPVTETNPVEIIFQVTDYFDLQNGEYYGKYYQRFFDGQNTFIGIKWEADYLMYYHKKEIFMDDDALNCSGYFWVEITTPKIRKGAYTFSSFHFGGGYLDVYVDGKFFKQIDNTDSYNKMTTIGPVVFTETKEHKIKFEAATLAGLFWDRVVFTPL